MHVLVSSRADGDFHLDPARADEQSWRALHRRRRALVDLPWTQPDEVHGTGVLVVGRPGEGDGAEADAVVTCCDGAVLGIWVGDCAPVALIGDDGTVGAAHAGWRGAAAGVLEATVAVIRTHGAGQVRAVVGPCIHACCYEFGDDDLDALVARFGPGIEGRTRDLGRALDMPALVRAALASVGVTDVVDVGPCTGCSDQLFSHRARGERERHVMAVWREPAS